MSDETKVTAAYGLPCCGHKRVQHIDPEFSGHGNTTNCRCCTAPVHPEPGACGDPECHVLHRDPAHPLHPHERPHRHLVTRHVHPEWHGHCDPDEAGYKPCDQPHWHFWWRHAHA